MHFYSKFSIRRDSDRSVSRIDACDAYARVCDTDTHICIHLYFHFAVRTVVSSARPTLLQGKHITVFRKRLCSRNLSAVLEQAPLNSKARFRFPISAGYINPNKSFAGRWLRHRGHSNSVRCSCLCRADAARPNRQHFRTIRGQRWRATLYQK